MFAQAPLSLFPLTPLSAPPTHPEEGNRNLLKRFWEKKKKKERRKQMNITEHTFFQSARQTSLLSILKVRELRVREVHSQGQNYTKWQSRIQGHASKSESKPSVLSSIPSCSQLRGPPDLPRICLPGPSSAPLSFISITSFFVFRLRITLSPLFDSLKPRGVPDSSFSHIPHTT